MARGSLGGFRVIVDLFIVGTVALLGVCWCVLFVMVFGVWPHDK